MNRHGVRPSVRLSAPFARCSSVRRVCCCGPDESIDRCTAGLAAAVAGSATFSAYVDDAEHGLVSINQSFFTVV